MIRNTNARAVMNVRMKPKSETRASLWRSGVDGKIARLFPDAPRRQQMPALVDQHQQHEAQREAPAVVQQQPLAPDDVRILRRFSDGEL